MAEAWPAGVPQRALIEGYNEEDESNEASFKPEVGPALTRRRAVVDTENVNCFIAMTYAQYDTLKTFYRNNLKSGTLLATMLHPRRNVVVYVRITKLGSPKHVNGTRCHTPLELQVYLN